MTRDPINPFSPGERCHLCSFSMALLNPATLEKYVFAFMFAKKGRATANAVAHEECVRQLCGKYYVELLYIAPPIFECLSCRNGIDNTRDEFVGITRWARQESKDKYMIFDASAKHAVFCADCFFSAAGACFFGQPRELI